MHFTGTSVTLALLPALGSATRYLAGPQNQAAMLAASNAQSPNPNQNQNAGNFPGQNNCGVSSFTELSQPNSAKPLTQDCQQMLQCILQDNEWIIDQSENGVTVVSYGTCAFNAKVAAGQPDGTIAFLGNADVIDLVTDSIEKYAEDGNVGCQGGFDMYVSSAGGMPCDAPQHQIQQGQQVSVDWTLSKAEDVNSYQPQCYVAQTGGQGGQGGGQFPPGGQGNPFGQGNQFGQPGQFGQGGQPGQFGQGSRFPQGNQFGQGNRFGQSNQLNQGFPPQAQGAQGGFGGQQ